MKKHFGLILGLVLSVSSVTAKDFVPPFHEGDVIKASAFNSQAYKVYDLERKVSGLQKSVDMLLAKVKALESKK